MHLYISARISFRSFRALERLKLLPGVYFQKMVYLPYLFINYVIIYLIYLLITLFIYYYLPYLFIKSAKKRLYKLVANEKTTIFGTAKTLTNRTSNKFFATFCRALAAAEPLLSLFFSIQKSVPVKNLK